MPAPAAALAPFLIQGGRFALQRGLPWLARAGGRQLARVAPRAGAATTRAGSAATSGMRSIGNRRIFGQNFTGPSWTTKAGNSIRPLNPTLKFALPIPEFMLYQRLADSPRGTEIRSNVSSALKERFGPQLDWLESWGLTPKPKPADDAASAAGADLDAPKGSADYSDYESKLRQAGGAASVNLSGIQQQYDKVINELRNEYKLAETEEEKERIRYIVADIEAQRKAGEKAIADIYAQKVNEINQTATRSRQQGAASAQEAGDIFRRGASDLRGVSSQSRDELVGDNRGLGIASSGFESGAAPWAGFMEAMAPISQNYAQRIGDIGAEGMEYIGAVTGAQGAAQAAEMQRLAMATNSSAMTQHAREVAQRIATERLALAQNIASLRSQQASEMSSGRELNAQLANAAIERQAQNPGAFTARMQALGEARDWGLNNPELNWNDFVEWHTNQFGVAPGEDARAAYTEGVKAREEG